MKILKITALALAAVMAIAAALLLVVGIPSDVLTSTIQARVERETGYRIKVAGTARFGLWPFHVIVSDVTVIDPTDNDLPERLKVATVEAELPLRDLLSGNPRVTELRITRPVIRVPLLRERTPSTAPPKPTTTSGEAAPAIKIERVTLADGAVILTNPRDRVENRISGIGATATIAADRRVNAIGSARLGDKPVKFEIKATAPTNSTDRQAIPVQFKLDAPDISPQPLTANADVRLVGTVLMINSLSGALGADDFNGWASVDLASKPRVKLDLDFQKLVVAAPSRDQKASGISDNGSPADKPWSDLPIDLSGLNYADAQVRVSVSKLDVGTARFSPAAVDATLVGGVLRANFARLGVYGGEVDGDIAVDVSGSSPMYLLRADLTGVQALPLLSGLADFDKIDGKMLAKIGVRSTGGSQRAIMSNLSGTAFVSFQDGAIRGVNVAQMIRSLTSSPLSGWQDGRDAATDLTQLGASFRIERGQATTSDLALVGPLVRMTGAGTVDLGAKSLALRVEPKLVMTLQGQGSTAADPVGLGIPVAIQGPWATPRFYPDMAGILDNPDAAYAKLREMGKGLFGSIPGAGPGTGTGANTTNPLGGQLGDSLGSLIQQGLGAAMGSGSGAGFGTRGATAPATPAGPQAKTTQPPGSEAQATPPAGNDQSPMNSIMKQLFGR